MRLISFVFLQIFVLHTSNAFRVDPRPRTPYKKAISQETKQPFLPILPVDDYTYSPMIPCPNRRRELIDLYPDAATVGLSESLRIKSFIRRMKDMPITLTLSQSGVTTKLIPPRKDATPRTVFGLDNMPTEYWFNNKIHTFGNTGMWGGFHALMAPFATKLIDKAAYEGKNAREIIAEDLRENYVEKPNVCILDLCSGVGMSTRALSESFKDAELVVGVDTSPEMINMARFISQLQCIGHTLRSFKVRKNLLADLVKMIVDIQIILSPATNQSQYRKDFSHPFYARGNAERVKVPGKSFDLVTIMYALHEIPKSARYRILREARRLLKDGGTLAIADISEGYNPSPPMLAGEPYVLEYQKNIMHQINTLQGFNIEKNVEMVPGHVNLWVLTRKNRK